MNFIENKFRHNIKVSNIFYPDQACSGSKLLAKAISRTSRERVQSNLSYPNVDYPKLLGYSKTMDSLDFFPIIYCNKTTYYLNFDYPKNSIFQSD